MSILDGDNSGGFLQGLLRVATDPGLLGSLQAYGNSPGIAPQPASRLPLARPNGANILGNMAGGYLQGKQYAAQLSGTQADAAAKNLANLTNLQNYNLTAPYFNQPQISMSDLQAGKFDNKTMAAAQTAQPAGQQNAPAPSQNPIAKLFSGILGGSQQQPTAQPTASPLTPAGTPQQPPTAPQMVAQAGPAVGGTPMAAPANQAPSGLLSGNGMPQGGNPIVQHRLNQLLFGANLTPVQQAIIAQGGDPYDPKYAPLLQNEAIKASGINPVIGGDRAGIPAQSYDLKTGSYNVLPGQLQAQQAGSAAVAAGKQPYELQQIGARGAQERQTASFEQGLKNQNTLVPSYNPQTQTTTMVTQTDALAKATGKQPVIAPPNNPATGAPAAVGMQKDGSYVTAAGTTIPAPQNIGPAPKGFQNEPSAGQKATQATYADTIKGWEDSVQPAQQTEQRFLAMWQAEKALGGPTGAWAEAKVDIGRQLIAAGMDKDTVNKLLKADPAQAQIILKNNFGTALSTLSAAKLGRITQNEIFALQKNLTNVGLEPGANAAITAQGIGIARQQQALARDWSVAQQIGYPDPYTYEREWAAANPLQGFVDKATQELGTAPGQTPQGAKVIGTYQGKQVIEMPDGSRHVQQ